MKLYIATPINARQDPTMREKLISAKHRVEMLKEILADDVQFKDYELTSTSTLTTCTTQRKKRLCHGASTMSLLPMLSTLTTAGLHPMAATLNIVQPKSTANRFLNMINSNGHGK